MRWGQARHGRGHKELILGEGQFGGRISNDIVFDSFEGRDVDRLNGHRCFGQGTNRPRGAFEVRSKLAAAFHGV
jgi:hypothetical protein